MKIRLLSLLLISLLFSVLIADNPHNLNPEMKMVGLSDNQSEEGIFWHIYKGPGLSLSSRLGYTELYGILITKVVKDSPAWQAGIKNNDILMELNGYPIFNVKEFDSIKKLLQPGDTIWLTIWREGKIFDITTKLQGRTKEKKTGKSEFNEKVTYPVGWGGGSWIPYWAVFPVDDINELITHIGESTEDKGFAHNAINEDGVFMSGGGGKVNIGKGFFLGGVGAGYSFPIAMLQHIPKLNITFPLVELPWISVMLLTKNLSVLWELCLVLEVMKWNILLWQIQILTGLKSHQVEVSM